MRTVTGTRSGVLRRLGSLLHVDPLPAWLTGTLQKMQELQLRGVELVFTLIVVSKISKFRVSIDVSTREPSGLFSSIFFINQGNRIPFLRNFPFSRILLLRFDMHLFVFSTTEKNRARADFSVHLLAVHPMGVHPPVTTREVICHVFPYDSSIRSNLT